MDLQDEQKLFYALIGQAIEHWSRVEDALCDAFLGVMGVIDEQGAFVARAAFYAVMNFDTKLAMTHAAICYRYPLEPGPGFKDERRLAWDKLHNRLTRKSAVRNRLALSGSQGAEREAGEEVHPTAEGLCPETRSGKVIITISH